MKDKKKKAAAVKAKKDKAAKEAKIIEDANEQAVNEAIDEHEAGTDSTTGADTSFAIKQAEMELAKIENKK